MSRVVLRTFDREADLSDLAAFFLGAVGPGGGLKAFVSGVDHLTVTATSDRVVRCLELDDPRAEAVSAAARNFLLAFGDGGLTLAGLTADLTRVFVSFDPASVGAASSLAARVVKSALEHCKMTVKMDSIRDLLPVVRSVLTSKSCLSKGMKDDLSLIILRGFLQAVNVKQETTVPLLEVRVQQGREDHCELLEGFSYRIPELDAYLHSWMSESKPTPLKVLVVNLQLRCDMADLTGIESITSEYSTMEDKKSALVTRTAALATACRAKSISVLANQKVVDDEVADVLRKEGILVLERLGTKGVRTLCRVLGCTAGPLTSLTFGAEDLNRHVGLANRVWLESGLSAEYLRLVGEQPVHTLNVQHWNEENCEEIELLCQRAISALYSILSSPFLVPGGGCAEASVALRLFEQASSLSGPLSLVLSSIAKSVCAVAVSFRRKPLLDGLVDPRSGHLWFEAEDSCSCGAMARGGARLVGLVSLGGIRTPMQGSTGQDGSCVRRPPDPGQLMDSYLIKEKLFATAIEVAQGLSAVELIIQKS